MTEMTVARVDLRAPSRELHRRRDIQGLRALAVLMVVAFHAGLPVPGGFTGVDVFFVISGFVITSMLHREFHRLGTVRLASFYGRRFLRLAPALALLVSCVAVASALLQSPFGPQQATAQTGLGAMLLSANLVIAHASGDYFATDATFNPLLNTWTLSVEEQFYLIFPTILLACWWLGSRMRRPGLAAWIVLIVSVASFWLCLEWSRGGIAFDHLSTWLGGPQTAAFYFAPARAWEFGIGALLAIAIARSRGISSSLARWAGLVGLAMLAIAALSIRESMPFPGLAALLPVIGTALVILAGCGRTPLTTRALGLRPLVAIGDLSYSWYLWHWPVIVFVALLFPADPTVLVVAAVASLIPAAVSYVVVEQPIRRWHPRRFAPGATMSITTLGVPIVLCIALLYGAQAGWGVFDTRAIKSTIAAGQSGADDPAALDDPTALDDATSIGVAGDADQGDAGQGDAGRGVVVGGQDSANGPDVQAQMGGEALGDPTWSDLRLAHKTVARGCVNTEINPKRCSWGPMNPKGTILVIGDSQAYAVADGVIAAASELGYRTIVSSRTGCPFLARQSTGEHDRPCAPWQQNAMDYVDNSAPDVVVIANRSGGYVRPERGWRMIQTETGGEPKTAKQARESYAQALRETVEDLRANGTAVVIVGAVPELIGYLDQRSLLGGVLSRPPFTVSRSSSEAYRSWALKAEQELAAQDPAVVSFDPIPALCEGDVCASRFADEVLYQDETHLSVGGALRLVSGLRAAILTATDAAQTPTGSRRAP